MATATTAETAATPPYAYADADTYIRMSGVSWQAFEGLAERTRGGRLVYDGGELEIMSPSFHHEDYAVRLADLVIALGEAMGGDPVVLGSTTWKATEARKGVEADSAFYLDPAKLTDVEAKVTPLPAPDLVIEVDLRRPDADRSAIYAAIGAVEVWEFNGETVRIRRLTSHGAYADVDRSGWFPIGPAEVMDAVERFSQGAMARRRAMREFAARLVKGE